MHECAAEVGVLCCVNDARAELLSALQCARYAEAIGRRLEVWQRMQLLLLKLESERVREFFPFGVWRSSCKVCYSCCKRALSPRLAGAAPRTQCGGRSEQRGNSAYE